MRYEVRLEAQDDSGNFRVTRLNADSAEQAQELCEQSERELCAFSMDDDRLASLTETVGDGDPKEQLQAVDRGHWFAHHQTEPYLVVSVDEVEAR